MSDDPADGIFEYLIRFLIASAIKWAWDRGVKLIRRQPPEIRDQASRASEVEPLRGRSRPTSTSNHQQS